jgi:hypothetical protein
VPIAIGQVVVSSTGVVLAREVRSAPNAPSSSPSIVPSRHTPAVGSEASSSQAATANLTLPYTTRSVASSHIAEPEVSKLIASYRHLDPSCTVKQLEHHTSTEQPVMTTTDKSLFNTLGMNDPAKKALLPTSMADGSRWDKRTFNYQHPEDSRRKGSYTVYQPHVQSSSSPYIVVDASLLNTLLSQSHTRTRY